MTDKPAKITLRSGSFIILLSIVFGAWLRFTPAAQAGFPINDGGMFYTMIGDLQKNGYALPAFTTYNRAENIPFAYPPFPLYVAALLTGIFHIPVMQILLWLPALTSVAVIVAFYFFAKALLNSETQAALATLFFTLIPRTFSWFLMGGGLTRSFGQFFLMLTATSAIFLFTQRKNRYLFLTILCGALTVLSHPEAGIHTAGIALLIWIFKSRNWKTLLDGIKVSIGVIAITALWWLPVISRHGLTPFLNAAQTGNHSLRAWVSLLTFNFTEEPLLGVIAVIGLVGLFTSLARRDYFFAAWFILPYILEPRSAPWIVTMPLTMLAAIACTDLLLPGMARLGKSFPIVADPLQSKPALLFLAFITFFSLLGSYAFALKMGADRLSPADRAAMTWIAENTPPGSQFIILTGATDPMHDPVQEWFPALAERNSETTLQGKEWTWGKKFIEAIPEFQQLQFCVSDNSTCVEQQAQKLKLSFEYLYITRATTGQCSADENCNYAGKTLIEELKKSTDYILIYESNSVVIFNKTHSDIP